MNIALASDHTGFEQLKQLQAALQSAGHSCVNFGPASLNPLDDYPDYIRPAAEAVGHGACERGIIMGGSGQGEAIVANRVPGVRCAVFYGPAVAKSLIDADGTASADPYEILRLSRRHNDANMLSLAVRFLSLDEIIKASMLWLGAEFSGEERHSRRIAKIDRKEG